MFSKLVTYSFLLVLCATITSAKAVDLSDLCLSLAKTDKGEDGWKKFVESTRSKYQDWAPQHGDADIGQYLNDKLIEKKSFDKDVPSLKDMVCWIALYKEFNQPLHSSLQDLEKSWVPGWDDFFKEFTWEGLRLRIIQERKKLAEKPVKKAETTTASNGPTVTAVRLATQ